MNTTMHSIFQIIQIVSSILLVITVSFQQSDASLGAFSGDTGMGVKFTRRGFEKFLYQFTIVLAIIFIISSIIVIY
jgi:protein translocase SecG subunit